MIYGKIVPGCADLTELMDIRFRVFVEEQGFDANIERDAFDPVALHALVKVDDVPAGTARLYQQGKDFHIGRVAVLKEYRGQGLGELVMRMLMAKAVELGASQIEVGAQKRVEGFYTSLGFQVCGPDYLDEGVPHIPMRISAERVNPGCGV